MSDLRNSPLAFLTRFSLFVLLITIVSCSTDSTKEIEKTGDLKEYYYPLENMEFPAVYKYRVHQKINGVSRKWEEFLLIQKDENDLYLFHTYNDTYEKTDDFKVGYGPEAFTLLERHQSLGNTKLAPERFSEPLNTTWEQSSKKPVKYTSEIDFADSSGYYTLKTKGSMTYDGIVRKDFPFTKESRCAKIQGTSELLYTRRTGGKVAQLSVDGYVLDLKGVGAAYIVSRAPNYFYESTLIEIFKKEDAVKFQERMRLD